jgi:hypothetical protein
MKKKAYWDEQHVREWERDRKQKVLDEQMEQDWQRAQRNTHRLLSEAERGPTRCTNRQCRRRRRCVPAVPTCVHRLNLKLPPGLLQQVTEDFYSELQLLRRAVARDKKEWPL